MGVALQLRRGTTAEVAAHAGKVGEIVLDLTANILYTYDAAGNKHAIQGSGTGTQGEQGVAGTPGVTPVIDTATNTITGVDAAGTAVTVSLQAPGTSVVVDANGNLMITNPDGSITTVTINASGTVTIENAIPSGTTLPTTGMVQGDFFFITSSNLLFFYNGTAWATAESQLVDAGATNPTTGALGELFFNTAEQAIYTHNGTIWVRVTPDAAALEAEIAAALITNAGFASAILAGVNTVGVNTGVVSVTALPSMANSAVGDIVFLDAPAPTGQKLYTYSDFEGTGSFAWESKAAFGDLVGNIAADQIQANTIQSSHITAGIIDATKIAVGAVSAAHIAASAIGADKIAANAITAHAIAANVITSAEIAANAITTSELAANAVTAVHIQAGSISANELTVTALYGKSAKFSASQGVVPNTYGGLTAIVSADGATGTGAQIGLHGTGSLHGVVGESEAGGSWSCVGWGQTNDTKGMLAAAQNQRALEVFNYSTSKPALFVTNSNSTTSGSTGTESHSKNWAVTGITSNANGWWGFRTAQKVYAAGGYSPFTGSHISFGASSLEVGDIVSTRFAQAASVDNAFMSVERCTAPKDKKAIGVVSIVTDFDITALPDEFCDVSFHDDGETTLDLDTKTPKPELTRKRTLKDEYLDLIGDDSIIEINSVGEGGLNCCGENGDIEAGDYICSSSLAGKGMKQESDVLHNFTVAKALVDVAFSPGEIKLIPVTYHCG